MKSAISSSRFDSVVISARGGKFSPVPIESFGFMVQCCDMIVDGADRYARAERGVGGRKVVT